MDDKLKNRALYIIVIILIYYGFRFVTQAGQGLGVVQNDGYGGTGGIMLVVAGVIAGNTFLKFQRVEKRPKRSQLKDASAQNFNDLTGFANSLKKKK